MARRLKIYYPESQIAKGQITRGKEWMTEDGEEYIGTYHTYITGEVFTLPEWDERSSVKLVPYAPTKKYVDRYHKALYKVLGNDATVKSDTDITRYSAPHHRLAVPTEQDFENGYYMRYAVSKRNDPMYPMREITSDDMKYYSSAGIGINQYLWKLATVQWKLTGPEHDIVSNGVIITPGIVDTNRRVLQSLENDFPSIKYLFRDLKENTIVANPIIQK